MTDDMRLTTEREADDQTATARKPLVIRRAVEEAIHVADCEWGLDECLSEGVHKRAAEAVLAALDKAGRLLPEGGETTREFNKYSERIGDDRVWTDHKVSRLSTRWPDGSTFTTPWREVTE